MSLLYFPLENSGLGYSILFDRITSKIVKFLEFTLPGYSNSYGKVHLSDYCAKYDCISVPFLLYQLFVFVCSKNVSSTRHFNLFEHFWR